MNKGIYILTGPSGSGKTTVGRILLEKIPTLARLVTTTSRPMRTGEIHGKDYFYTTEEEFKKSIANNEFFEWDYHYGNYYGSSKIAFAKFIQENPHVIMVIDINGAKTIKSQIQEAVTIFLKPGSMEELGQRLKDYERNNDDPAARLASAPIELSRADTFDYQIVNKTGELENTVSQIIRIIDPK